MAKRTTRAQSGSSGGNRPGPLGGPVFAQPEPTEDPLIFRIKHASDADAYRTLDQLNRQHRLQPMPFPAPRGARPEPQLTLGDVLGTKPDVIAAIVRNGQIVFHSTGDCGSTKGPKTQNEVTDKMLGDFKETNRSKSHSSACCLAILSTVSGNWNITTTSFTNHTETTRHRSWRQPAITMA